MGQEASLPQQDPSSEPGLDPPSAQIPPSSSRGVNGGTGDRTSHHRPGKALKQILSRRGGAGDSGGSHGRDAARAAAEGGHLDPDSSSTTAASSAPAFAAAPVARQDAYYTQDQQQQQQYYNAQQQQQSQNFPYDTTGTSSAGPAVIGLMYTSEGSPTKSGNNSSGGGGRKVGKLISSMRNLSIGTRPAAAPTGPEDGIYKTTGLPATRGVRDWETRWDEDDEDESDEEDEATLQQQQHHRAVSGDLLGLNELRPGMDVAHASATPSSPVRTVQEQPASSPPPPYNQADAALYAASQHQQAAELIPTQAAKPQEDRAGGVDFDTSPGVVPIEEEEYEKPNVDMFLPMLRVLGKGSFGKVVLVQKRRGKETGQLYAMKILRKTYLVKRRQIERTRTERKVLSVVDHPFIMKLHYAFQSEDKLYLVLDYCPGGELFFHLSRFRRFPERVARFYAAELLLSIGHLHKRGIIYRDLKPENVLLDAEGHVKLGDFGLAKAGIRHPCEGALSMCGTPEYMAPEVLSQAGHGFCVDYWGLGMLVYEMMTGLPPWYTTDRAKLFRRLKSAPLDIPSYFSPQSADCVSGLLERNPRRRLGVSGIRSAMEHPFFRSINWRALYARRVEAPIKPCEGWKPQEVAHEEPCNDSLERATANFDNQFTRMPVESDAAAENNGQHDEEGDFTEELHADTFVGFTFDEQKEHKEDPAATPARPRTHHTAE